MVLGCLISQRIFFFFFFQKWLQERSQDSELRNYGTKCAHVEQKHLTGYVRHITILTFAGHKRTFNSV